jgi:hypothetical protein
MSDVINVGGQRCDRRQLFRCCVNGSAGCCHASRSAGPNGPNDRRRSLSPGSKAYNSTRLPRSLQTRCWKVPGVYRGHLQGRIVLYKRLHRPSRHHTIAAPRVRTFCLSLARSPVRIRGLRRALEPADCHLETSPRRNRSLRRRLALVRARYTGYPNRMPQRAGWPEIEHAPPANRSDRSRGFQRVSFALGSATSSIHSAPSGLTAKSNRLLRGLAHNDSLSDVSRLGLSEVASTIGLQARR